MTLDNLLRIGKLRAHAVDKAETTRLLAAAERGLADARVPDVSADTRLDRLPCNHADCTGSDAGQRLPPGDE